MLKCLRRYLTEIIAHCMFTHMCYVFLSIFLTLHYSGLIDWGCKDCEDPAVSSAPFENYLGAAPKNSNHRATLDAAVPTKRNFSFPPGFLTVLNIIVMDFYGCEISANISSATSTRLSFLAEINIFLLIILTFSFLSLFLGGRRFGRTTVFSQEFAGYFNTVPEKLAYVIFRRAGPRLCFLNQ